MSLDDCEYLRALNENIKNKYKQTNLIKYGVENVMQSIIVQQKYQNNAFKHNKLLCLVEMFVIFKDMNIMP